MGKLKVISNEEIIALIDQRLKAKGLSRRAACRLIGRHETFITDVITCLRKGKSIQIDTLIQIGALCGFNLKLEKF